MLTLSPKISLSSMMISPTCKPIRNSSRLPSGRVSFCSAMLRWNSTAVRTASTALANSTSMPSAVVLTMRPRCVAMVGWTSAFLISFSRTRAPSTPASIRRSQPTVSAASTAASRRSTRSSDKKHQDSPSWSEDIEAFGRSRRQRLTQSKPGRPESSGKPVKNSALLQRE